MRTKDEIDILHYHDWKTRFQHPTPERPGLLYQFRTFKSLWLILDSDGLWATHARFSNDDAERSYGIDLGKEENIINDGDVHKMDIDSYIVCFCALQDLLSQWRGYAPYGGVSIGFDFRMHVPFTTYPGNSELSDGYAKQALDNVVCYTKATQILYYKNGPGNNLENCLLPRTHAVTADMEAAEKRRRFFSLIPYIKHPRFEEEKEYRIVINSSDFATGIKLRFEKCINYRFDGDKKVPYIILKPGDPKYNKNVCSVRMRIKMEDYPHDLENNLIKHLKNALPSRIALPSVFCCEDKSKGHDLNDTYCFGCIRRQWIIDEDKTQIILCRHHSNRICTSLAPDENNSIIISQGKKQREVFEAVHEWATIINKNATHGSEIKVWCEGHLPVRTIMVGPCKNKEEMAESIKHYCQHSKQYWLRDVDVIKSNIPYRTPSKPDS